MLSEANCAVKFNCWNIFPDTADWHTLTKWNVSENMKDLFFKLPLDMNIYIYLCLFLIQENYLPLSPFVTLLLLYFFQILLFFQSGGWIFCIQECSQSDTFHLWSKGHLICVFLVQSINREKWPVGDTQNTEPKVNNFKGKLKSSFPLVSSK